MLIPVLTQLFPEIQKTEEYSFNRMMRLHISLELCASF